MGLENTGHFKVVWSNQWEPSTKTQHASEVYEARFGSQNHSNVDIEEVLTESIPDHDVLVGGFPCQDYSVATTLNNSKGLLGKKGVLWWSIYRIIKEKKKRPGYLILENVDRLLKSPALQRGRDFAVMLKGLSDLGYAVEWRVINAAEYGFPQRRRRVFLVGYHRSSSVYKDLASSWGEDWIKKRGVLARAFPLQITDKVPTTVDLSDGLVSISKKFNQGKKLSPFENSGICFENTVKSLRVTPNYDGAPSTLSAVLQNGGVSDDFFIPDGDFHKWKYLKGGKKEMRTSKEGFKYHYTEGSMTFPDALDKPSRTIITGEGGKSPSRFKHVVAVNERLT